MNLEARKLALVDPRGWDAIWLYAQRFFEAESPRLADHVRRAILEPLEAILHEEHDKNGFSDVYTMGLCFLVTARKAAGALPHDGDPEPMRALFRAWEAWHVEVARIAQGKAKKFEDGPKQRRLDALGAAMRDTWQAFVDRHGREPSAVELWEALPLGAHIQEKDEEERTIFWRCPNGREEVTGFKSFQNRLTRLQKK
jgi:hypothetical protein